MMYAEAVGVYMTRLVSNLVERDRAAWLVGLPFFFPALSVGALHPPKKGFGRVHLN
jgi:hypothetical protein